MLHINSYERCILALSHEEPDILPIFEFGIEIPIFEKVLGKDLPKIKECNYNKPRILAKELVNVYETLGLDMVTIGDDAFFSELGKPKWKDPITFVNEFGQIWRMDKERNRELYAGGEINLSEDIKLPELDPSLPSRMTYAKQIVKEAKKRNLAIAVNVHGGFSHTYLSCGLERFFIGMIKYPEKIKTLISKFGNFWIEISKQLIEIGVDAIGVGDDLADKKGPFISPTDWRIYAKPTLASMVSEIKRKGGFIFFHSDGNINTILDDLVTIGFDGLHSIEPLAGMDIEFIKKRYGDKLCLLGNVDCSQTLCFSNLIDVAKETREVIRKASIGGGHILCSSNTLHSGIKIENFLTMVATGRKFGRYPLSNLN